MEYIPIILSAIAVILLIIILVKLPKNNGNDNSAELNNVNENLKEIKYNVDNLNKQNTNLMATQREEMQKSILSLGDNLRKEQKSQQEVVSEKLNELNTGFENIRKSVVSSIDSLREANIQSLDKLREENKKSLDEINGTVNEKLQKTLDDKISKSFEAVNKRLAEVYEGLGEMKNVAAGVSDLKNVLSNVKTKGIMGEIQLGAILDEILAPEQYAEQIPVTPKSSERVDFAVKLPASENGDGVLLPIDSKFPSESYAHLLDAYESGNAEEVKNKRAMLESDIKKMAKSIRDKYIAPPYTTDFAIMFLPFEGLYAEVVNIRGLVEKLQNEYKVNVASPSTMAAMLNSLQMGFRTLAIQKKSGEVWKILEATKKEFATFETVLENTRNRLRQADDELDKLIGTRTRAINRKLKDVGSLETTESSQELLEMD